MPSSRVDFRHIRTNADFARVLEHYGIEAKPSRARTAQLQARCPFHDDRKPSLKVNTEKNIFHCFPCGAKGNVLDFVQAMEGSELRAAAKTLADICGLATTASGDANTKQDKNGGTKASKKSKRRSPARSQDSAPETEASPTAAADNGQDEAERASEAAANPPLTFALKLQTEPVHPWLEARGITAEMAQTFGLGLATRGSLKDRLAIPLHNAGGELIGYCGRYPGNEPPEDVPKYQLPKGFHKELEVFNQHRLPDTPPALVLVESYLSVFKLHQWGLPAVSVFGRSISPEQRASLVATGAKRVVVLFDGDAPGREGAAAVAGALASDLWVRIAPLPDGAKPHHLEESAVRGLLRRHW